MNLTDGQIEYLKDNLMPMYEIDFETKLKSILEETEMDFNTQELLKMDIIKLLHLVELDACESCGVIFLREDKIWSNDGEGICENCASCE